MAGGQRLRQAQPERNTGSGKRRGHHGGHEWGQEGEALDDFADAVAVGLLANAADMGAHGGFADVELFGHLGRGVANADEAQDLLFGAGELVGAGEEAHHERFAHAATREDECDSGFCGFSRWGMAIMPIKRHDSYRALRFGAQREHAALALGGFGKRLHQRLGIAGLRSLQAMCIIFEQLAALQDHLPCQIAMLYLTPRIHDDHAAGDFIERGAQELARFLGKRKRRALAYIALLMGEAMRYRIVGVVAVVHGSPQM
jgi:hypothetical protein